jgi:hypothetical protein
MVIDLQKILSFLFSLSFFLKNVKQYGTCMKSVFSFQFDGDN